MSRRIWDVVSPDGEIVGAIHAEYAIDARAEMGRAIAVGTFPVLSTMVINNQPRTTVPRGRQGGRRARVLPVSAMK